MNKTRTISIIILAAGASKRMNSRYSKVLHQLAGKPVVWHVGQTAAALQPIEAVVVTAVDQPEPAQILAPLLNCPLHTAIQNPPQGTGHAVQCAVPLLSKPVDTVLVLYGDTPLLKASTLQHLLETHHVQQNAITVMGMEIHDPDVRYGRLIQSADGALQRIVEYKDASETERRVPLCNSGVMAVQHMVLEPWLKQLQPNNVSQEYYLTDLVEIAGKHQARCGVAMAPADELEGINNRADLAAAEAALQQRYRRQAMAQGATLVSPETTFLSADTQVGQDVIIHPFVVIGPGVVIGDNVEILPFCHLEKTTLEEGVVVGPYARLRDRVHIGAHAEIGNFVEVKNTTFADHAKAKHLSYIGDAVVGAKSNLGAGTITCNYDGMNKHKTTIGAEVMVGSNTALVAPVTLGDGAYIGAGSVITEDVPAAALAIGRGRQHTMPGRAKELKEKKGKK